MEDFFREISKMEFVSFMFYKGNDNFEVPYVGDQSFCFCSSLITYTTYTWLEKSIWTFIKEGFYERIVCVIYNIFNSLLIIK